MDSTADNTSAGLFPRVFDTVEVKRSGNLKLMRNIDWQNGENGSSSHIEYGAYVFELNELTPESVTRAREIAETLEADERVDFFWDEQREDPENHQMVMVRDLEK